MIRAAICLVLVNATTMGSVATLLVLALGGGFLHVGILAMALRSGSIGQIAGVQILRRVGKARLAMGGRLAGLVPVAVLATLVAVGRPSASIVATAIAAYAVMALIGGVSNTGWWPLLQDNAAGEGMGWFFTRMRTWLRLTQIASLLAVGYYLGAAPEPRRFLLLMAVGAAALLGGAWSIRRVPETPRAAPDAGLLLRLRLAARARTVRPYLRFIFLYMFLYGLITPFWVVMYKRYGLGDGEIVVMMSLVALGNVGSLLLWGRMVDAHGGRAALSLSLVLQGVMGLAWLGLPAGGSALLVWAGAYSLLWGFAESGCQMGRTSAMFRAVPAAYQADSFMLTMLASAAGGAAGAMIGGRVLAALTGAGAFVAGLDARLVVLAGAQVCILGAYLASRRLTGHAVETPARVVMVGLLRRVIGQG